MRGRRRGNWRGRGGWIVDLAFPCLYVFVSARMVPRIVMVAVAVVTCGVNPMV